MNTDEKLAPEIQELLDNTPVLTDETIQAVADANRALNRDPDHIAGIIKSVFVNDILCAMEEQGLNKNQLAKKWGRSRQHVGKILDKEKSKNFTIDTIVSLSMTMGLRPQCIKLEPMEPVPAQATMTRESSHFLNERLLGTDWCRNSECACTEEFKEQQPATDETKAEELDLLAA